MPLTQPRRTETPNAVMTTVASPTVGATTALAVWRVRMEPGQAGPEHAFDSEQVWTVVAGTARFAVEGVESRLVAGETIVLPAGVTRRIRADGEFEALVAGCAGARVSAAGHDGTIPPWVA